MREGRKLRKEHDGNLNASEHRPEENYTKRLRVEHLSLGLCIMFATSLESKLKLVCHDVRCPPRNGAFCHWALVFLGAVGAVGPFVSGPMFESSFVIHEEG